MSSDYRPRGGSNSAAAAARSSSSWRPRSRRSRPVLVRRASLPRQRTLLQRHARRPGKEERTPSRPSSAGSPAAARKGRSQPADAQHGPQRPQRRTRPAPFRAPGASGAHRARRADRARTASGTYGTGRPPARTERPEPTPQEITTPKLYVGNLAYEAGESDLFDLFSKVGQ